MIKRMNDNHGMDLKQTISILVHQRDPIRPVDPIVFDRIRVGFHPKPASFIKNRSDPTGFLSDSCRSESLYDIL
jgi:hypothetical protein